MYPVCIAKTFIMVLEWCVNKNSTINHAKSLFFILSWGSCTRQNIADDKVTSNTHIPFFPLRNLLLSELASTEHWFCVCVCFFCLEKWECDGVPITKQLNEFYYNRFRLICRKKKRHNKLKWIWNGFQSESRIKTEGQILFTSRVRTANHLICDDYLPFASAYAIKLHFYRLTVIFANNNPYREMSRLPFSTHSQCGIVCIFHIKSKNSPNDSNFFRRMLLQQICIQF